MKPNRIGTQINADFQDFKYTGLTDKIIQLFYKVYNKLGYGFLEKVYQNALVYELNNRDINIQVQYPIKVLYENKIIGEYYCDILVDEKVIIEIKAIKRLIPENEAQLLNYLKATNIEVGLLLNFGMKPEVKRKAYSTSRKSL